MKKTMKPSHTQSAGTKLTVEQHAAIKAQADAQGLELSEYIRRTLLSTPVHAETPNPIESLLLAQLTETLALRIIVLNLASMQASGEPLTAKRLQAVLAHADAHKKERVRLLLSATTNDQAQIAASSETKEAGGWHRSDRP